MGWIGRASELEHTLRTFKCDTDKDGKLCVDGGIVSFMGAGDELVIDDNAVYYVDGKPHSIVNALKATSYGKHVVVI